MLEKNMKCWIVVVGMVYYANLPLMARSQDTDGSSDEKAVLVEGSMDGECFRTFQLSNVDGQMVERPDLSRSFMRGTTKMWLSDKGPDEALSCKILGFAGIPLLTRDGKSADARHAILLATGEAYGVHPTLENESGLPFRSDPDRLAKLFRKAPLVIQTTESRPEVIRFSGTLVLLVRFSGDVSSKVMSVNSSAAFMPGVVWTVKQPMQLRVRKDGKDANITLNPGTYRLDENSIPKSTQE